MPRSVSSPAIAGLEFLTGFTLTQVERSIQRRKIVIPAEAGIQKKIKKLDSCFHRNDRFLFHLLSGVSYSVKTFVSLYITGLFNKKPLNLGLTNLSRNVGAGSFITGGTEKLFGRSMFDQLPQVKEDHIVGNAPRLTKDMRDDHNRVMIF